jgi:hypothetical protein
VSAVSRQPDSPFATVNWQPDVVQMLDESHLVAVSASARYRTYFAVLLGQFLQGLQDVEVCTLYGRFITDIDSFCYQLERTIPGPLLERRIDGPHGVTALLRSREVFRGRAPNKFRYYVWHDADILLANDQPLFGRLVDAIMGVAAEAEYVSDDVLLIHRGIFVGSPDLDSYARLGEGQFRSWAKDSFGDPFWQIVTGIDLPPVSRFLIDTLGASRVSKAS